MWQAGRVEYRTDSFGNVHGVIGKASFSEEDLLANLDAFVAQILRIKPATVKGEYVKNISISSTMGPGIKIENSFDKQKSIVYNKIKFAGAIDSRYKNKSYRGLFIK